MRAIMRLRIGGFSVVEIIVVGIILTVIGINAAPRFSRGSEGIAPSTLAGDLAVLRNGLDLYASDHGGGFPSVGQFASQMTQFTDANGKPSPTRDTTHCFGPYLRTVPLLPVGPKGYRGADTIVDASHRAPGAVTGAWVYNPHTGEIHANLTSRFTDGTGQAYCRY